MTVIPSCPICKARDASKEPSGWLCSRCDTVFDGSQGEWEATSVRRERWAGYFERLGACDG